MTVEVRALGRLLFVMLICRLGADTIPRKVPFLPLLDSLGSVDQFQTGLTFLFFAGAALSAGNATFRYGCLLAGAALLLKVAGSMPQFSNGRTFDGLLLTLIGLCASPRGVQLLRAQVILLYAGAALSKVLDSDWWNGQFILAMYDYHHVPEWLHGTSTAMGIATIAVEAAIGAMLAVPRLRSWAVLLMAAFHSALVFLLREDFSTFYYSVALSTTLMFLPLANVNVVDVPRGLAWLAHHSVFTAIRQAPIEEGKPYVEFENGSLEGIPAWLFLHAASLPVALVAVGTMAMAGQYGFLAVREALIGALLVLFICLYFSYRRSCVY